MSSYNSDGEWAYTLFGGVRHWRNRSSLMDGRLAALAICYASPGWFSEWRGQGNQEEYEKCASLPACKNCVKRGAPDESSLSSGSSDSTTLQQVSSDRS